MYIDYEQDLENAISDERLVDLTDDDRTGQVNMTAVNDAIRDACAEFDSYAGVKYAVPVATVTDEIKRICKQLWICHLYERRPGTVPEDIEKLRERMTSTLKDIARGLKSLGVDPAPAAASQASSVNKTTNDRVFTRGSMKGF